RDAREVRSFDHDHVVAHGCDRQLADVVERDGEIAAAGRHVDRIDIELDAVVAFDGDAAAAGAGRGCVASRGGGFGGRAGRTVIERGGDWGGLVLHRRLVHWIHGVRRA